MRTDTLLEERVAALEEAVDDIQNYVTLTLKISSASLSAGTYSDETFYDSYDSNTGTYSDGVEYPVSTANGYTLYKGALVETGGSEAIAFEPIIIINNCEIAEPFDDGTGYKIYQKKVKKGETLSVKIFANGHAMKSYDYTPYNNVTEYVVMTFSSTCYFVVVPNKENAEMKIYQSNSLKTTNIYTYIGTSAGSPLYWNYAADVFSYAEGASLKYSRIPIPSLRRQIGWFNEYTTVGYYYREGDINKTFQKGFKSTQIYENIIIPLDLNGESNVDKFSLTIDTPSPSRAKISLWRAWHEKKNDYQPVSPGNVLEVYSGESVYYQAETEYVEGDNYYPFNSMRTITGNSTLSITLSEDDYVLLKLSQSNVADVMSDYKSATIFDNEEAVNGAYAGWDGGKAPNGDGYLKLVMPENDIQPLLLYASGYVPSFRELEFTQANLNHTYSTNLTVKTSPYLIVTPLKEGYNAAQYDADNAEYKYDGYQSIEANGDGSMNVWLYCSYYYAAYEQRMVRDNKSSLSLSIYSSSQFKVSSVHQNPAYQYTIYMPSKNDGYLKKKGGFYYQDEVRIRFSFINGVVASNGYVGDVTVTNEEGLSQVLHIYCKWYKAS